MNKEKEIKREMGWLIYGVAIGGILGLMGNLWASYYMKWLEITYPNSDWTFYMIFASILIILVFVVLLKFAFRMLGTAYPKKTATPPPIVYLYNLLISSNIIFIEYHIF